jgi:hypothetical protein
MTLPRKPRIIAACALGRSSGSSCTTRVCACRASRRARAPAARRARRWRSSTRRAAWTPSSQKRPETRGARTEALCSCETAPLRHARARPCCYTFLPRRPTPRCAFFSKSLAKSTFLLTDAQLAALPCLTLEGDDAKASGVAIGANPKITLVTAACALAAAVARFGSEAALVAEVGRRRARAEEKAAATAQAARAIAEACGGTGAGGDEGAPLSSLAATDPAAAARLVAAHGGPSAPSGAFGGAKEGTCNFPHLNQSSGFFTQMGPTFGLHRCPPRGGGAGGGDDDDDDPFLDTYGCG